MNPVVLISSILVGLGALFMMAAIIQGERAMRTVPGELRQRWRIMITLMLFFLTGYTLFVVILVSGVSFPTELITGPVFFGGALFVFIVIDLAMRTIGKMKTAEESLLLLNESLEQRVAERTRELRQSREFLRTVLDSQNDAVIIIDVKDFRIVGANAPFLKELGAAEEEIIGKTCYEVTHNRKDVCLPPDDGCPLVETVKTGRHAVAEHIHYGKEGEKIYAEVSTSPIRDKEGNVVRVIHVSRDITARKQADEKLRRYAAELKQSNEDVLSFAYIVSHDLRAPWSASRGSRANCGTRLRRSRRWLTAVIARWMKKSEKNFRYSPGGCGRGPQIHRVFGLADGQSDQCDFDPVTPRPQGAQAGTDQHGNGGPVHSELTGPPDRGSAGSRSRWENCPRSRLTGFLWSRSWGTCWTMR